MLRQEILEIGFRFCYRFSSELTPSLQYECVLDVSSEDHLNGYTFILITLTITNWFGKVGRILKIPMKHLLLLYAVFNSIVIFNIIESVVANKQFDAHTKLYSDVKTFGINYIIYSSRQWNFKRSYVFYGSLKY